MEKQFYFIMTTTLLLLAISTTQVATQAPSFDSRFSGVNPADGVTGQVEESLSFITLDECIVRYVGKNCSLQIIILIQRFFL